MARVARNKKSIRWWPDGALGLGAIGTIWWASNSGLPGWARLTASMAAFVALLIVGLLAVARHAEWAQNHPPRRTPGPTYMRVGRSMRAFGATALGGGFLLSMLSVPAAGLLILVGLALGLVGHTLVARYEAPVRSPMPQSLTFPEPYDPQRRRSAADVSSAVSASQDDRGAGPVRPCKIEINFYIARMIERRAQSLVTRRLRSSPAVALTGPRQCGKTTLARRLKGVYFDLEQDSDRLRLDLAWGELEAGRSLVILDEAQSWPEVFNRLRGAIDQRRRRMGRFLLLGSVAPSLMLEVSESLAGRLSLVELTPLLLEELETAASRARHWLCGGFPDGGVLRPSAYSQWARDYLRLLAQRDLPTWGLPASPGVTQRLLRMLAAVHGQTWNASQIGKSLGLSYHTVNSYLDYLEGAFLIRRLAPFQTNIRKRLRKRPKVYWRDSGLLHASLNIAGRRDLLDQPWVGASWEGYVIEQAIGTLLSIGATFEPYFFRTSDGHELDLVLDFGRARWAVEVKLTASPGAADMRRLTAVADHIGATRCFLVSQTREVHRGRRGLSCNLPTFLDELRRRAP